MSAGGRRVKLPLYDGSVFKIMVLAAVLLVVSTALVGYLSYRFTHDEVLKKLKTEDLTRIAKSLSGQVEARLDRAKETSRLLADDPAVVEWVSGAEKDDRLGDIVRAKLRSIPPTFDYTNSYVVSKTSGRYWAETGGVLQTMDPGKADDAWFYQTLEASRKTDVVVDTNDNRKDTFVFANVLIGDVKEPIGVAGVGLSLSKLSADFASYAHGSNSRLWLVAPDGTIRLSGKSDQIGGNVSSYVAKEDRDIIAHAGAGQEIVLESKDDSGKLYDMISYPIRSSDLRLWVQIPRSETVGFLDTIKVNTALAAFFSLLLIVFLFAYVSRKLADPYKQALRLNEELEQLVDGRTEELAAKNKQLTEGIVYANRIQQAVLPSASALREALPDSFVLWKPRDVVGGDFYWVRRVGGATWIAVGDCTGHGVPGALMTMLSVSLLDRIAEECPDESPAGVLRRLNVFLKIRLNQNDPDGLTDDGLEIGLCRVKDESVVFAGAGIRLFVKDESGVQAFKGDRKTIGYRRTPADHSFEEHVFASCGDVTFYMATDGIVDQNGGERDVSLGKTRLKLLVESYGNEPLAEQGQRFEHDLDAFMGGRPARDDMTLLAFRGTGKTEARGD